MVALHRVLILLAVVCAIVGVVMRFLQPMVLLVTSAAWLRFGEFLLVLAIALMLAQVVEMMRARAGKAEGGAGAE